MLNPSILKLYKTPILLAFLSSIFYYFFAYDLVRIESFKLIGLYTGLFVLFHFLIKTQKDNFRFLTVLAILFRLVFLFSIPNLSQDFYRFIWDGRMILEGFNPYLYTPDFFITEGEFPVAQAQELHNGMGSLSASHYTNYPPLNQLCFVIAGLLFGKNILGSVVILRLLIIAADFGTLFYAKKLLEKLNIPVHNIFWYVLNPFIIIELTGNLHFEGVMIFFLIWSLYLLHSGNWKFAAVVFACSVSVKLITLMFLPLYYQWFVKKKEDTLSLFKISSSTGITKLIVFYCIATFTILLFFAPFYSSTFIKNYTETVGLWFNNFEFNASFYYIAREFGYLFRGYNEIAIIGKIVAFIVFGLILVFAFFRQNHTLIKLITSMLFVLSFYYFTATTVHPWYIATLVFLSIFTNYKFPLVWSFIIILSYLAYRVKNTETLGLVFGLEYLVVYSFFVFEVFLRRSFKF
jgi:hypothetical protein